ncbi:nitroreductase family protein [Kutzneria sp. CA-103260]|uniref:nitroreductase family protein n=1 Tax=Kutzneria sp. CA-103260 TaxID=2802641 RepID=UPI001BABD01A|nr:nitroreductase family protein [Kutzneria sp. CA-103260]QUQ64107.1 nitroreductase [Kutzneria sp. CA-103260]
MLIDEALTTTRAVRRGIDLRRPVTRGVIEQCLRIAVQAPTAANRQDWRFVGIDDPGLKHTIADYYRAASTAYLERAPNTADTESARFLAQHIDRMPVLLLPCVNGRHSPSEHPARTASRYGSLYPAVWSFMLAARSRGLATAFTTVHLAYEREVADLLGIPYEEVTQGCLVPVGYARRWFGPAPRRPVTEVTNWNRWRHG